MGTEDSLGKREVDPDSSRVIEGTIFEIIPDDTTDKTVKGNIEMIIIGVVAIIEVGIGPERDHSPETIGVVELEVQAIVDQGQDPRANTNRDRIRCYNCREYDHFARDCPSSREEKGYRSTTTNAKFGGRRTNSLVK